MKIKSFILVQRVTLEIALDNLFIPVTCNKSL